MRREQTEAKLGCQRGRLMGALCRGAVLCLLLQPAEGGQGPILLDQTVEVDWILKEGWVVGSQKLLGADSIVAFMRPGETAKDWSELVTVIRSPQDAAYKGRGENRRIATAAARFLTPCHGMKKLTPQATRRLQGLPARILVAECDGLGGRPYSHVEVLIAGPDAVYSFRRTRRTASLEKSTAQRWARFLQRFRLRGPASADVSSHSPTRQRATAAFQARLEAKLGMVKAGVRRWMMEGRDPRSIGEIMGRFEPLMKEQKFREAEEVLDHALGALERH